MDFATSESAAASLLSFLKDFSSSSLPCLFYFGEIGVGGCAGGHLISLSLCLLKTRGVGVVGGG